MREEDTDWFKRMAARARATVRHDLMLALIPLGILAAGYVIGYWLLK